MKRTAATEGVPSQEPTSARILQAAAALFRERGYSATTTREISTRLNINKASLYYHISGKEDLLYGICLESLRRIHNDVANTVKTESDPRERVRKLCHSHLTSMLGDLDMHATMLNEMRSLTGTRYDEVLLARDKYESLVSQTVSRAQRAGALRRDIDVKYLTLSLLNLLNWTMAWYRPDGGATPDELADTLADIYLNGTTPPPTR